MTNEEKGRIVAHVNKIQEMIKLLPVPAPDSKAELALSIIHSEMDAIEGECVPTRKPRGGKNKAGAGKGEEGGAA